LIRLEQGVLDTVAESVVAGDETSLNAFRQFARRTDRCNDWITIRSAALETTSQLDALPDGARVHIQSALQSGNIIVVSPATFDVGDRAVATWWRIDSSDGSSLGHGYRGWGNETPEYGTTAIPGGAARKGAQDISKKYHCRMMYAIVAPDPTLILDTTSPEFKALLKKDDGGMMARLKRRAKALIQKVLKQLGLSKPYC
jgi:hypothetical protein